MTSAVASSRGRTARLAVLVIGLVAAMGYVPKGAASEAVLRVCADPNNMPFSNDRGEGIDNGLARLVAGALGAELRYVWMPQRRGFVRNTLAAGTCDVMMEAPVGYDRATTTAPVYRSGYVFVYRNDRARGLGSLDDPRLAKLRVGVQLIGDDYTNTPPAQALARRGLSRNVVGFPVYGDYGSPVPLAPIMDAVAGGDIDVAIVWGPLAGWYARQHPDKRLALARITPENDVDGLPFAFDIAMAVRLGDEGLRRRLDGVIRAHRAEIRALLDAFGVPVSEGTVGARR